GVEGSLLLGLKFRKGGTLYIFIDGNTGMARLTTEEGKELSKTQITRINSIGGGMQLKIPISEKHQYITIGGMTLQTPLTIAYDETYAQFVPALFGGMGLSEKLEKATITTLLTAGNTLYVGEIENMSPFVTLYLGLTHKNFNIFGSGTYQYKSTKVGGEKKDTLTFGVGSEFKLYGPFEVGFEVYYKTIRNKSDDALSGLLPKGLGLQFYLKIKTPIQNE
ncbi:MAG: hypothetical protein QW171_03940, partial [Candidatus Bilamarchaeaceae archaeon]